MFRPSLAVDNCTEEICQLKKWLLPKKGCFCVAWHWIMLHDKPWTCCSSCIENVFELDLAEFDRWARCHWTYHTVYTYTIHLIIWIIYLYIYIWYIYKLHIYVYYTYIIRISPYIIIHWTQHRSLQWTVSATWKWLTAAGGLWGLQRTAGGSGRNGGGCGWAGAGKWYLRYIGIYIYILYLFVYSFKFMYLFVYIYINIYMYTYLFTYITHI